MEPWRGGAQEGPGGPGTAPGLKYVDFDVQNGRKRLFWSPGGREPRRAQEAQGWPQASNASILTSRIVENTYLGAQEGPGGPGTAPGLKYVDFNVQNARKRLFWSPGGSEPRKTHGAQGPSPGGGEPRRAHEAQGRSSGAGEPRRAQGAENRTRRPERRV